MPLFEVKLISPLAVHFTQEHIKTTFRDGHDVDATYEEIVVEPGIGEYDLILRVPFPNIEIIRWAPQHGVDRNGKMTNARVQREGTHWFTLDNRRLYCLQKAAVRHWPLRVGAAVDILYVDPGHVWRKYDSDTEGLAVNIRHSSKDVPIASWDWRKDIKVHCSVRLKCPRAFVALEAASADDDKATVDLLMDARAHVVSLTDQAGDASLCDHAAPERCATPSTEVARSDGVTSDGLPDCTSDAGSDTEESVAAAAVQEIEELLRAPDYDGFLWVHRWNERYLRQLGLLREFLVSRPDKFQVVSGGGKRYTVYLQGEKNAKTHCERGAAGKENMRDKKRGGANQKTSAMRWVPKAAA